MGRGNHKATNNPKGLIEDMPVEGDVTCVIGKMPVAESFGFSNDIRAATQGRAVWNTENAGYDEVPPRSISQDRWRNKTEEGLERGDTR